MTGVFIGIMVAAFVIAMLYFGWDYARWHQKRMRGLLRSWHRL